jgi:UDP-glucose 4-epimerase
MYWLLSDFAPRSPASGFGREQENTLKEIKMQLVIGGFGFVGSNTIEALLNLSESCVITQYKKDRVPEFLKDQVGKQIFIEPADIYDIDALRAIGKKHNITGIINLATGGMPAGRENALQLAEDIHATVRSVANTIQVGNEWGVKRVTLSSAPVVYNGISELPWREDQPLQMTAAFPMEAAKKCGEILSNYFSLQTNVECIEVRLASMYGPNYDPTRSSLAGRLVHAALKGEKPNIEGLRFGSVYAADGGDQCYIKDAAQGIALLQTANQLNHRLYNVSSGRSTTNQEIVNAIKKVIPDFDVELPPGHQPGLPEALWYFDITRLHKETGFEPRFDIEAGIADYIAWLRLGNAA